MTCRCGGKIRQIDNYPMWQCTGCGFALTELERVNEYRSMTIEQALHAKWHTVLADDERGGESKHG